MKKLILFFILLQFNFKLFSQANVYHLFPDTTAVWSIDEYNVINHNKTNKRFGIKGDTIINSIVYKKIVSVWNWDTSLVTSWSSYYAAIREQDKKIYAIIGNGSEHLLYDFNLLVGDTMKFNYSIMTSSSVNFSRVVTNIDSFLLQDGSYRKRFIMEPALGTMLKDTILEGIGSVFWQGLFNPFVDERCTCGDDYTFTCYKELNTVLYLQNSFCKYCFCGLNVGISNSEISSGVLAFPNPFSSETKIEFNGVLADATLILYNSLCQQIKEIKHISGKTITINRENLPTGVYYVQLKQNDQNIIANQLIIINH